MGFRSENIILIPEEQIIEKNQIGFPFGEEEVNYNADVKKRIKVWIPLEILSFGYVTGVGKLVEGLRNGTYQRAGICVVSWIFQHLYGKLKQTPLLPSFAPKLAVYEDFFETEYTIEKVNEGDEYVDCMKYAEKDYSTRQPFTIEKRYFAEHNKAIALKEEDLRLYLEKINYHIVTDAPFVWETCAKIVEWMDALEKERPLEYTELEKDKESLAIMQSWRERIRPLANIDARILFVCPKF